jgi:Ca2+-binding EF-hand superfamily protein
MGQIWDENENGIDLPDFCVLVTRYATHKPVERIELLNGAIQLFSEIDINGDGRVDWGEFIQYVTN